MLFRAIFLLLLSWTLFGQQPQKAEPKVFHTVPVEICGAKAKVLFHYKPGPHPEEVRYLFDDDPATAFKFPPRTDDLGNDKSAPLTIEFEEPQTMEGYILRPGWQKDLKTFDAYPKPALLNEGMPIRYEGRWISKPANPNERPLPGDAREMITYLRPFATMKNMSERIYLWPEASPGVTGCSLSADACDYDANCVAQDFKSLEHPSYIYVSEFMPILAGHPSKNELRDGVIDFLLKVRDHRYEDIQVLNMPENLAEKKYFYRWIGGKPAQTCTQVKTALEEFSIEKEIENLSDHPLYRTYFMYVRRTLFWFPIRVEYPDFWDSTIPPVPNDNPTAILHPETFSQNGSQYGDHYAVIRLGWGGLLLSAREEMGWAPKMSLN